MKDLKFLGPSVLRRNVMPVTFAPRVVKTTDESGFDRISTVCKYYWNF